MATPTGDADEVLDDLHPLHDVRLPADFRDDPEHLLVDKLKATNGSEYDETKDGEGSEEAARARVNAAWNK